ncbi:MAG: hypothetical protein AAGA96_08390 [Verrucomicrobiota bacterium]
MDPFREPNLEKQTDIQKDLPGDHHFGNQPGRTIRKGGHTIPAPQQKLDREGNPSEINHRSWTEKRSVAKTVAVTPQVVSECHDELPSGSDRTLMIQDVADISLRSYPNSS